MKNIKTTILFILWLVCIIFLSFTLNDTTSNIHNILFWFVLTLASTVILYIHCEVNDNDFIN